MGKSRAIGLAVAAFMIVPSVAAAHTKTVYAGGPVSYENALGKSTGAGVNNFMINRVTINVGDTVVWNGKSLSNGFHTVDIPALGGKDEPLILPTGKTVSGANDAAGNPFWFNGQPVLSFNPVLFSPIGTHTYNGTARIDSGLPLSPKPVDFKVKFTKPGRYHYFCDVHAGMSGWVIVKPKGKKIPSAKADKAELVREEKHFAKEAKQVDKTKPPANTVSVGASAPGGVEVFAMFPATLTISHGTTVKFMMSKDSREVHTATFGPAAYLNALANAFGADPGNAPSALYPSDVPHITLTPTTHGNGFVNTGAMDRDSSTPLPSSNTITFTTVGTYHYQCMIHPFMHGTVVVK
jgi:plastocyanin